MKTGENVNVRCVGTEKWISGFLDLKSSNGLSLAVSADEGLFPHGNGLAINIDTGRQQLLLMKENPQQPYYLDMFSHSLWEVVDAPAQS